MGKSKDELELEKLVEIDGEFCVPHESNEARHVVDWGPFEPPRSAWYIVHKFLLFLPAMYLFILAVQVMKAGAVAIGPDIQGQFPFANGISTLGLRLARRLLRPVRLAGRRDRDQPLRGRHADEAADLHDALRVTPGCLVHRPADGIPLRGAEPARPQPRASRSGWGSRR